MKQMASFQKKLISWVLIAAFLLTSVMPAGVIAKAAQAPAVTPEYGSGGDVTFYYQGTGEEKKVVVKGEFNNWEMVDMQKDENNLYTATLKIDQPGVYAYDIANVDPENENEEIEKLTDSFNPVAVGGSSAVIRTPAVDQESKSVKLYYQVDGSEEAKLAYRVKGAEEFKETVMVKDAAFSSNNVVSASFANESEEEAVYEYKILVNGEEKNDPYSITGIQEVILPATNQSPVENKALSGIAANEFPDEPGGKNVWRVTGNGIKDGAGAGFPWGDWDPGDDDSKMNHLVGNFYAKSVVLEKGNYEFKFTKNGDWGGSYGSNDGKNFSFSLKETTKVNFYLNEDMQESPWVRISLPDMEDQGIPQYTPAQTADTWPRLVGDLQEKLGENNWSPGNAKHFFTDYYFDGSIYKIQVNLPVGKYESKVVFGNSWEGDNFGAGAENLKTSVLDPSTVTFTADVEKKMLSDDYEAKDSAFDGEIDTSALYFNSKENTYKKPFGAVKRASQDVTFRFAAKMGDAEMVKLELIDESDISAQYNMQIVTSVSDKDYWEVTVPAADFDKIGIWGYKFIILDGMAKIEYGDDGSSGGTGAFSEEGQTPYNLTVYDENFKTPDWMKDAVVYQIFPDRFYDGNKENNKAKTVDGARGQKVQLFDGSEGSDGVWSDYPENPRQSEEANKPYYPNAKTDGVWSNEFYGGDIEGIIEKINYLKTLGVTAIYLNPVAWASSNHKYDATDYRHLDPMFGEPVYNKEGDPSSGLNYEKTKEASDKVFERLSNICSEQGIYLITDGVFNHVGDDSIYFDRYGNYPEIGAYEYWARVWDTVEASGVKPENATGAQKKAAEEAVKKEYKQTKNPATGKNYTDEDFRYIGWFDVGPKKVVDGDTGELYYEYEGWWGYNSLPVVKAVNAENTNLTNDADSTIAGAHEYNNVTYREDVIGYDLSKSNDPQKDVQEANSQRWQWMGSSGWRLDVAPDVSNETWEQFRIAVKSAEGLKDANGNTIKEPIILGEEWNVATHYLLGNMFDSVMNYQFRAALQNFIVNGADAANVNEELETIRENYPEEAWYAMLNLVDSHDTVRNITKIDNPGWEEENTKIAPEASERAIQLQALTAIFQMSYPGAPTIYYGDEVGVTGTKDPDSRRTFPWERVSENGGTYTISNAARDKYGDLFNTYVTAAKVRNENKEIFATGDIKTAYAKDSVLAYARKSGEMAGLSVINTKNEAVTFDADVSDFIPDGIVLEDKLGGEIKAEVEGGKATITVPAVSGLMMVSTTKLQDMPAAPQNVKAEPVNGANPSVKVTWDAVEGAGSYEVYRTILDGMQPEKLDEVSDAAYEDKDVKEGTRYYYYVKTKKGNLTSNYSETATAVPSLIITEISKPQDLETMEIEVGKKTPEISTVIKVPGFASGSAISVSLVYYLEGQKDNLLETKMRPDGDMKPDGATFKASFEPAFEGTYHYYVKATVNKGVDYETSENGTIVTTMKNDGLALEEFNLKDISVESNRVQLEFGAKDVSNVAGFEIYRKENNSGYKKIASLNNSATSYVDLTVSNDVTYTYKVEAYNNSYNRCTTNEESITPKLTMVTVTMRLHIPESVQTEATDTIYIAGDVNGWNASGWAMKKPSGATDNNIVEYTFTMLAGKSIQYKYTRGSWDTEAFTTKDMNDKDSPGNYAYSSTDTNIHATIKNEGGNKMMIEDYVIRWVDMPLMITVPRKSYQREKEEITFTTKESSFNLQASVPRGVKFTINGVDINEFMAGVTGMDKYGNVRLDSIPLKTGENRFELHIEPTPETLAMKWYTDTGRAQQATDTKTFVITREDSGSTPTPSPGPSNPDVGSPQPTETPDVTPQIPEKSEAIAAEVSSKAVKAEEAADGFFYTSDGKKVTDAIVKTEKGRFILNAQGEKYVSSIVTIKNGNSYITDTAGTVITGKMVKTNGLSYYTTKDTGKVVKNKLFKFSGSKYFASEDGTIATGRIVTVDGRKYYTTKGTGRVAQDKLFKLNGKKYIASRSGELTISKWVTIGNKKYYCNKNGEVTKVKKK